MEKIAVILPTYNERENVEELVERIEGSLKGEKFEVVVVDDNSPDGTAEIAKRLARKYGNVKVVERPEKLGLGSAVMDGVKKTNASVIAVMDSDLQHPPEVLPLMYEKIKQGSDIVVASRYVKGSSIKAWGIKRKAISRLAILIAHLLLPKTRVVKDPSNGYFMFRRDVIKHSRMNPKGFKILMEMLVKGRYRKVEEIPFSYEGRKRGKSKLDFGEVKTYVKFILELTRAKKTC